MFYYQIVYSFKVECTSKFLYLHIKPHETFNVNKTDGTHEIMFQKVIEMNWRKE